VKIPQKLENLFYPDDQSYGFLFVSTSIVLIMPVQILTNILQLEIFEDVQTDITMMILHVSLCVEYLLKVNNKSI
jgi:hypothetical protein